MLQQANAFGEEYVFLKLDVIKAFDRLEWPFLLTVVRMSGLLSRFLVASFAFASSSVLLNGRETKCFALICSVRQGCPLLPFLFILAFDVLGDIITQAIKDRSLQGVVFPEWAYTHGTMYMLTISRLSSEQLLTSFRPSKSCSRDLGLFQGCIVCGTKQRLLIFLLTLRPLIWAFFPGPERMILLPLQCWACL